MPFKATLTELSRAPVYQAIAEQAAHLHLLGMNPMGTTFMIASCGSAKFVPDTTSAAMPVQVSAFDQCTKMLLERIAACAGQFDGLADGGLTQNHTH
ncbi:MAG: hypothetical protein ACYDAX_14170 [Desulfobacteria bacterium]